MFREIRKRLETVYDKSEAHSLALVVMEEIAGIGMAQDLANDYAMTEEVESAVGRLMAMEPIQYVTGWCEFCGIRLKCDRRALIPRPETEWMVGRLIGSGLRGVKRILDLGTGTGCIAIALAKACGEAQVTAVDISEEALALARENAAMAGVVDNVKFVQGDMTALSLEGEYDIIISNPPYITLAEEGEMRRNVLEWEPRGALFVPDEDKLRFHRAIAEFAKGHLAENGVVVMEINETLAEETAGLMEGSKVVEDQYGRKRFVLYY